MSCLRKSKKLDDFLTINKVTYSKILYNINFICFDIVIKNGYIFVLNVTI